MHKSAAFPDLEVFPRRKKNYSFLNDKPSSQFKEDKDL